MPVVLLMAVGVVAVSMSAPLAAAMTVPALAVAFWWPRRRVTVRPTAAGLEIRLRGERFDQPAAELDRLRERLAS